MINTLSLSDYLLIVHISNEEEALNYFETHLKIAPLQSLVVAISFPKTDAMRNIETSNHVFDYFTGGTVPFVKKWREVFKPYNDENDPIAYLDEKRSIKVGPPFDTFSYEHRIPFDGLRYLRDETYVDNIVYNNRRKLLDRLITNDSLWESMIHVGATPVEGVEIRERLNVIKLESASTLIKELKTLRKDLHW